MTCCSFCFREIQPDEIIWPDDICQECWEAYCADEFWIAIDSTMKERAINEIEFYLPMLIMIESFLAVIPMVATHRWGHAVYWFTAGLLNFAVIFLIKRTG